MRPIRVALIATSVWFVLDTLCWFARFGDIRDIADDGPDSAQAFVLLTHWPGLMFSTVCCHLGSSAGFVVAEAITLVQMFILSWLCITIWQRFDKTYAV
jgi:hypothetical protein